MSTHTNGKLLAALRRTVSALLDTVGEPPLLRPPQDRERRPALHAAWEAIEAARKAIAEAEGQGQ